MPTQLDTQTIQDFRKNGVVVIRGKFKKWVDVLRRGVDRNLKDPSPDAKIYQGDKGAGRFLSDYCNWNRISEYRDFIFRSPAALIGAELMNAETVRLFHEHVLVKEAKTSVATPWHQDQPYYCVEAPKTVSIWIPLDDVPRNRAPEFVAGSHQWDKSYRPQRFNGQPLNENDGLEQIPDIDGRRNEYDIRGWALMPGDAIAFDYRTLHGAPANDSKNSQRRAFSLRLVGDDARFTRRLGLVTSPPFSEVTLKHGDCLDGPQFPVLYHK